MNQDTTDFLATLLWLADDPDGETSPLSGKTVYDFSPEFIAGAEAFIDGFRAYLVAQGFNVDKLADLERSFGGNCYLSLSGHGAGFFDDANDELSALQGMIKAYAGDNRFEDLEGMLEVNDAGKIDLSIIPEAIDAYRAKLFSV